jgi:membrane protease YdiL (CAAX protease family)
MHLILMGGYVAPALALELVKHHPRPALSNSPKGMLIVFGVQTFWFILVFGLACIFSKPSRELLLLTWKPGWWVIPLGICYSVAIRVLVGVVLAAIVLLILAVGLLDRHSLHEFISANRPHLERVVDLSALRNNPLYFWLLVTFGSFVVAGLQEELWRASTLAAMRSLWPNTFEDRDGQITAVALIAIVFGFAHLGYGLVAVPVAALLGFCLGAIMVVHKSIWPAVMAHGFFDATTFALLPWIRQMH